MEGPRTADVTFTIESGAYQGKKLYFALAEQKSGAKEWALKYLHLPAPLLKKAAITLTVLPAEKLPNGTYEKDALHTMMDNLDVLREQTGNIRLLGYDREERFVRLDREGLDQQSLIQSTRGTEFAVTMQLWEVYTDETKV